MKRAILTLTIAGLCISATLNSFGQDQTSTKMETITHATEPVKAFFNSFGKGDFEGIVNTFHNDCTITAVREGDRQSQQIYGTYHGKEEVKNFIYNLGNTFDTKAFIVENIIGEGNVAFANGKFTHVIKSTGKTFSSDWSLMCKIKDGKILEYHFYEDSAKFAEASK